MRRTLFRGSDDGFTFIGVIIFLLILMLLVPAVSALLSGSLERDLTVLEVRRQTYAERQVLLDEGEGL